MEKITDKKTLKLLAITFAVSLFSVGVIFVLNSMAGVNVQGQNLSGELYEDLAADSEELINLSNSVNEKIKKVNELDEAGDTEGALELIEEARRENDEAKKKALNLLYRIGVVVDSVSAMAGDSPERSLGDLETAIFYLSVIEELVEELVGYTESINNFFDALTTALQTDSISDRMRVERYLSEVSMQQAKINNFFNNF